MISLGTFLTNRPGYCLNWGLIYTYTWDMLGHGCWDIPRMYLVAFTWIYCDPTGMMDKDSG